MVRVGSLAEFGRMTRRAIHRGALETTGMASDTVRRGMSAGQREIGAVVVEIKIRLPGGVAGQASGAVVGVAIHPVVVVIRSGIGMAGDTSEHAIVRRIGMAISALIPLPVVLPAVYGEVLPVVVERGRLPGRFGMATGAIGRKLEVAVVRLCGLVEIV